MAVGDHRRHRTTVQAGPARLLLLPVVLAGAWTVVGLTLGSGAAHADTGSTGGSAGITLPAVPLPHASLPSAHPASAHPSEHEAHATSPSPSPSPAAASAAAKLPVTVVPKVLPKALPHVLPKALPHVLPPKVRHVAVPHPVLEKAVGSVSTTTAAVERTAVRAVRTVRATTTATVSSTASVAGAAERTIRGATTTSSGVVGTVTHVVSTVARSTDVVPTGVRQVVRPVAKAVLGAPRDVDGSVAIGRQPALPAPPSVVPAAPGRGDTGTRAASAPAADRPASDAATVPATAPRLAPRPFLRSSAPVHVDVAPSPTATLASTGTPAPPTAVLSAPEPLSGSGAPAQLPTAPVLAGTAALGTAGSRGGAPLPFAILPDGGDEPSLAVSSGVAPDASTALPSPTASFDVAPD